MPPIAATVPGYESLSLVAYFAPAGTPAAIVARLNQELVRSLNRADVKDTLLKSGVEPVGGTPEQAAAMVKTEMAKWGRLIKDAGIRE